MNETRGSPFELGPEVAEALRRHLPVVALESAFLSHGLPIPDNVETTISMQEAMRAAGVVPAVIGLVKGRLKVGINRAEIESVGSESGVEKISLADIAPAMAVSRQFGGTTVSATVYIANKVGIPIVATGGIGGVQRGREMDVSSDLTALAQTPVVLVCSGPKIIADIPATQEWLETHGISVIGYQTGELPAFYLASSGIALKHRADDLGTLVETIRWWRRLKLERALLVAVPVPREVEVDAGVMEGALAEALRRAGAQGIRGSELTPFLLAELHRLTQGATLRANKSLLINNARVAAQIAVAWTQG